MDKKEIVRALQTIICDHIVSLPDDITKKVGDIYFAFEPDALMFREKMIIFGSYDSAMRTITFFLSAIKLHKFDYDRLCELVVHEYGHAVGLSDEQMNKIIEEKKNA